MRRALAVICVVAGCGSFEDPSIVLDLRVLAMHADIPEQVIDVDLEMPMPADILEELADSTTVTALVADPGVERALRWSMTLCLLDDEGRCDRTKPFVELGAGVIDDPDLSPVPQQPTAQVIRDAHGQTMLAMLSTALEDNPVEALGGIDLTVMMQLGGVDDDPVNDVYAAKALRIAARIPADRRANENPYVDFLDAAEVGISITIPRTRCAQVEFEFEVPVVDAGSIVTLFPIEPTAVREHYTAPTLTGGTVTLQETITYQWLAVYGSFSDEFTGGGHDPLGNQSLLGTDWRAPNITGGDLLVPLWMIQRDERLGVVWLETCIRVIP